MMTDDEREQKLKLTLFESVNCWKDPSTNFDAGTGMYSYSPKKTKQKRLIYYNTTLQVDTPILWELPVEPF